jgi:hypothetical protein
MCQFVIDRKERNPRFKVGKESTKTQQKAYWRRSSKDLEQLWWFERNPPALFTISFVLSWLFVCWLDTWQSSCVQYKDDAAEARDAMNHILPLVQSPQQAPYSPLLVLFYFFSLFIWLQEASKQQRAILK